MQFTLSGRATRSFLVLLVLMHLVLFSTASTWPPRRA